jgi:hypothetical protein
VRVVPDFEPSLPSREKPATDWSLDEESVFAGGFYNTVFTAVTFSMIRSFGHDAAYDAHERLLHHHQRHFFLDGLHKLGLDRERSDAVRCAKYHCMSNALGGLRTRYGVESDDKAWLFYYPQPAGNGWPGPGQVIHTRQNMVADYAGWHANNGELLGNDGLVFVATHFIAEGDPYDGGYFLDVGEPVPAGQRARVATGEQPPEEMPFAATELDPDEWPQERLARAFRKYAVTWAADRAWNCLHSFGEPGIATVSRGLTVTIYQWLPRLLAAFPAGGEEPSATEQFVSVLTGVHRIGTMPSDVVRDGDLMRIEFGRGLFDFVAGDPNAGEKRAGEQALAEAWGSVARHFDSKLELQIEPGGLVWLLSRSAKSGG